MPLNQKFESAVGLGSKCDFRTKQEELSIPHRQVDNCDRIGKIVLAPGPTAFQGVLSEPCDRLDPAFTSVGIQPECGAPG